MTEDELTITGPCCACGELHVVRNIMMLDVQAPVPGTGWGCILCRLPSDGALAVVCDECLEADAEIRFACSGYVSSGERVERASLITPFVHDLARHAEAEGEHG